MEDKDPSESYVEFVFDITPSPPPSFGITPGELLTSLKLMREELETVAELRIILASYLKEVHAEKETPPELSIDVATTRKLYAALTLALGSQKLWDKHSDIRDAMTEHRFN